ncbi:MAG: metal ABC transporter permease [Planctomycetes bacterium]|nr:metal ABC transporter permease [Planctomycetota bacterium]
MIAQDFATAWQLFGPAWLAGWLVAVYLGIAGVPLVARGHAFLGAAVAQTAALGVAIALLLGATMEHAHDELFDGETVLTLAAIAFATLAALATGTGGSGRAAREGVTAWLYLASASLTVLLVANHPLGTEEVKHVLGLSVLGAGPVDAAVAGVLAVATLSIALLRRDQLALVAMDPVMAAAVGVPVRRLSAATSAWIGLGIGFAIHASGLLYAFGCLVLPALAAARACRTVRAMFWVAPLFALAGTLPGFLLAHATDLPPGHVAVALLAALVPLAGARRWRRPR